MFELYKLNNFTEAWNVGGFVLKCDRFILCQKSSVGDCIAGKPHCSIVLWVA
jgi:hypothetical protein